MRTQDQRSGRGHALRYVLLALLGGVTGVLLSRFVFPAVFERGGLLVFLTFAILLSGVFLIARLLRRGGSRP
jgi:hypothetical protein